MCLETDMENFEDSFKIRSHDRATRNNKYLLQIPKTKLKYTQNGLFFMGKTPCNKLPTKPQKNKNVNTFSKDVLIHICK